MAKIVTITNPLTGQPAQVDQLDHTAQQIDDGLNIARGVSNPNLLDNWYFGNPVNQRGQTSYTGRGYTIDRWMNENDKVVSTLENGLLKLTFSGVSTYMQRVQVPSGIQVTCSVLVDNISGDLFLLWQDIDDFTDTHTMQLSKGMNNITVTTTKQNYRFAIYSTNADPKTIGLKAAKIELGTQQTLAHQDSSGNWQLNELPNYAMELLKCQRYQFSNITDSADDGNSIGIATTGLGTTELNVSIPFPVEMRTDQVVIEKIRIWNYRENGAWTQIAGNHFAKVSKNGVSYIMSDHVFQSGQLYGVQVFASCNL